MTDTPGIEKFYGAAILLLRWWVHGLSREDLAREAGVSAATLYNYERGKTVPKLERRKKIARALGVSLAELDALAASLRRDLAGLAEPGSSADGRLAVEIAADLAAAFHRASLPLMARLVAAKAAPAPAATEEEIRALAPFVADFDAHDLEALVDKMPSLWRGDFVKLLGEESERAAPVDAGRALELASLALQVAERVPSSEGGVCQVSAWAVLANARRGVGDLQGAEEASTFSARLQAEGPGLLSPTPYSR